MSRYLARKSVTAFCNWAWSFRSQCFRWCIHRPGRRGGAYLGKLHVELELSDPTPSARKNELHIVVQLEEPNKHPNIGSKYWTNPHRNSKVFTMVWSDTAIALRFTCAFDKREKVHSGSNFMCRCLEWNRTVKLVFVTIMDGLGNVMVLWECRDRWARDRSTIAGSFLAEDLSKALYWPPVA